MIPLFVLHGTEEFLTGFYATDSHALFVFGWLEPIVPLSTSFIIFQLAFWALLIGAYRMARSHRFAVSILLVIGLISIYELHHVLKAYEVGGYYPGLVTAFPLYVVALLYWRELSRMGLVGNVQKYQSSLKP